MKKRAAALLLCALLAGLLPAGPAAAAGSVCFTAVEIDVLPLADETMPVWSGGYLYIPSTIFTGSIRQSLDIGFIPSYTDQKVILYSSGRSLIFYVNEPYSQDTDGNTYFPGAIQRGDVIFVPVSTVASYFGLQYSFITENVERGSMVWLRRPGSSFTNSGFVDAAKGMMEERYAKYLKAKEQAAQPEEDEPEPPEIADGKHVYLCLEASDADQTAALLDVLERYGSQAAFFCTPEFLESQGDLTRRMAATGQAVGVLVDGEDPDWSVSKQLEAGNAALARATCGKTRLAFLRGGTDLSRLEAEEAGFRCLEADLDRTAYGLAGAGDAAALLQRVTARRGNVSVWLGDKADGAGLRAFLGAAAQAEDLCLALTETAA